MSQMMCGPLYLENNSARNGGAIYLLNYSQAALGGSMILFINNFAVAEGGALKATISGVVINVTCLHFAKNRAVNHGGAVLMWHASLTVGNVYYFTENSCTVYGGAAIYGGFVQLSLMGNGSFTSNTARFGGALCLTDSDFTASGEFLFAYNHAVSYGGAISLASSNASMNGTLIRIIRNSAEHGGGIMCLN